MGQRLASQVAKQVVHARRIGGWVYVSAGLFGVGIAAQVVGIVWRDWVTLIAGVAAMVFGWRALTEYVWCYGERRALDAAMEGRVGVLPHD